MRHPGRLTGERAVLAFLVLFAAVGCSGETAEGNGSPNSGGSAATGGVGVGGVNTGGTSTGGSGGVSGTGGVSGIGGVTGIGGVSGTGGIGTGGTTCTPACGDGRNCCFGQCVNPQNDPYNCGDCGVQCIGGSGELYCGGGQCVVPQCNTSCTGGKCCGTECCTGAQLCCDAQGPLDDGPHCVDPSEQGTCPQGCAPLCICASPDTPIATPLGDRAIASLKVGDLVYSVDGAAVKAVPVASVHQTRVSQHRVVRVRLDSGATLEISAGHPTADGRTFADLRAGGSLDQAKILAVEVIPYAFDYTYDILPESDSGTYFAAGALIGSTLQGAAPGELAANCAGTH